MKEPYFWNNKIKDSEGNEESNTSQKYRNWWIRNGCPPIVKVCSHFGLTAVNTFYNNHVARYGWRTIEDEAIAYYNYLFDKDMVKEKVRVLKDTQKENEERLRIHKRRRTELLIRLGVARNPITNKYEKDPNINEHTAWAEIMEIDKRISAIQKDLYSSYRISEKVNDKLKVEQQGELTLNQNIKQAPNEELLKKYADYIERTDKPTKDNLDG